VDPELKRIQKLPDFFATSPQIAATFRKQQKVIDVADVSLDPQFMFHKLIQGIQVNVGKELARQIPDRQPHRMIDNVE
jgi:hypothetical protein